MSLTVVRVDGSEPRIGDYLLRWAFRLVDLWLATGLVAVVSVLVTEKGQRLGDLVAGTTVVRVGEGARLAQIVLDDRQAEYRPTFQEAQFLQQEEVQTAREVLQVLRRNGPGSRAEGLGEKAKATFERKMEVSSEMEPEAFLETVLRDYNHLNGRL